VTASPILRRWYVLRSSFGGQHDHLRPVVIHVDTTRYVAWVDRFGNQYDIDYIDLA